MPLVQILPITSRLAFGKGVGTIFEAIPEQAPFSPLEPTIFHQRWWLDVVTGGQCQEVLCKSGSEVVGRLPFVVTSLAGGLRLCGMPPLTHFLGPAIDAGSGAACTQALRRAQITKELLSQLPDFSAFWHKLHRGTTDTLAYQFRGYQTSVQFTFEIQPAEEENIWRGMRDKARNVIRRAAEQHEVVTSADAEPFADLYQEHQRQHGRRSDYSAALITRVCRAGIARNQGRIITANNRAGRPMAAIFYIWDTQAAYYLLSTRDPAAGNGAVSLLLWQAIKDISRRGLIFDFDGVANAGSALFFAGFGGEIKPRYVVSKQSLAHRLVSRLVGRVSQ